MSSIWTEYSKFEQQFLECTSIYYRLKHNIQIHDSYKRLETIYIKYILLINAREFYGIYKIKNKLSQRINEFIEVVNTLN